VVTEHIAETGRRLLAAIESESDGLNDLDYAHHVVEVLVVAAEYHHLDAALSELEATSARLGQRSLMRSIAAADAAQKWGLASDDPTLTELAAVAPAAVGSRVRELRDIMRDFALNIERRAAVSRDLVFGASQALRSQRDAGEPGSQRTGSTGDLTYDHGGRPVVPPSTLGTL
jgi:hypothetical protein